MLTKEQKAIHLAIPMAGAITPYLLGEFADKAVEDHLLQKGAIVDPAQMHHWQRPSAMIPLGVGIPMILAVIFNAVKDPAKQLMMLEFAAPLLVGGGWSVAKHAQRQATYVPQLPPTYQPQAQPQYQPQAQPPGAIQYGQRVFYRQSPFLTRGGAPRPTFGNR